MNIEAMVPGIIVVIGAIVNFAANMLKVKRLEERVEALERRSHEEDLMEQIVRRLRTDEQVQG